MSVNAIPQKSAIFRGLDGKTGVNRVNGLAFVGKTDLGPRAHPEPPVIYHGTPLTPRAALLSVAAGRAVCVSYHHPQDVEAVEAISPAIMFRFRCLFILAGCIETRHGLAGNGRLERVLRVVGGSSIPPRTVGHHPGYPRRAVPAQRQSVAGVAVREERRSGMAHGRTAGSVATSVRALGPRLPRVDRSQSRVSRLPRADGGRLPCARQPLARPTHAQGHCGSFRLPVRVCGQHFTRSEWMAL